jgi:serine/threonine protein kinase
LRSKLQAMTLDRDQLLREARQGAARVAELDLSQLEQQEEIGEGATAIVYACRYKGQDCAVKVLKAKDALSVRLLTKELQIVGAHVHKNLCAVIAASKDPRVGLRLVTERLWGSLSARLNAPGKRLTVRQRVGVMLDVGRGLEFLHSRGVVHRDVKPQNILITDETRGPLVAKVSDFGLSRTLHSVSWFLLIFCFVFFFFFLKLRKR